MIWQMVRNAKGRAAANYSDPQIYPTVNCLSVGKAAENGGL